MYRLSALSRATKPFLKKNLASLNYQKTCLPPTFISSTQQSRHVSSHSSSPPSVNEGFLQGNSANYVEEMYEAWLKDPTSVHLSWQIYFKNIANGVPPDKAYVPPPTIMMMPSDSARLPDLPTGITNAADGSSKRVIEHMKIQLLVRAYQVRGHHLAHLDPLHIQHASIENSHPPELTYQYYGFKEQDLDRKFTLGPGILPALGETEKELTLREIIEALKKMYCGSIGIEYIHIPDREQCNWIRSRIEKPEPYKYSNEEKKVIFDRLTWSDSFERFVASKYPSEKRFGLEGGESLIPGMKALIDRSVDLGVESIVIGMPHRGRLNVLSNVVRKPNESIFCEFSGSLEPSDEGSGDVKYHLGMNYVRPTPSGKRVHLSLVANPSHLEAVNPVVLGKTKALQFYGCDPEGKHAMAILMHGDAAMAGQGIVYETMGFYDLPSYSTGGTIHIVVNNQIGFTTDPRYGRSTPYCTDIAKSINAPVFHVNGDDVEAVTFVMQLAADWRQTFHRDCVIDLVCYRKHGHNETDQPMFTQPLMYQAISKMKPVAEQYAESLKAEGVFTNEQIEREKQRVWNILEEKYAASKDYKPSSQEWLTSTWPGFKSPKELAEEILPHYPTGVSSEVLEQVGKAMTTLPQNFNVHRNLNRILQQRAKSLESGKDIDWATAEGLAWGSLLLEGKHVRVSGQDVERGTFSQRHAVLHDQKTDSRTVLLNNISPEQGKLLITNSSLSEYGVLGFELGYSLVDPNALIIWEAQFGDFANTAQVIIDQFLAAGEQKWLQRTGLVLSLPHGYDGQGPEHSSARLERYLQLCDENPSVFPSPEKLQRQHQDCNMQVVYPSTPAQYFHVLRRQICRQFRKPLILPFSKSMLRHPLVRSSLSEMTGPNTSFQLYLPEPHPEDVLVSPEKIKKHIFCSGQVYYALLKARDQNKMNDIAISRIEQLNPFPFQQIKEHADKYPNADILWCQEEPLNMGCWYHVQPRLTTALSQTEYHTGKSPSYAGRPPSASVATGNKKQHYKEEHAFLSQALIGHVTEPRSIENGIPVW
ncbi:oxoglutarate dehydrogenase, E1 component [Cokeromyces recurvatus]|uniref:oxoglutarate dehydrogenase, E1 component n=1 Tax=Cokeromyces recurvatus TaxID=90255 RepID=UPI002220E43B|nr:oxoglutarate dehydrogenase, E1 component [Cokeromyces recurvatus]KAI7908122.1 oxoglutarate dehydrogenase, E1 component [Cokeromyces recurvatus]